MLSQLARGEDIRNLTCRPFRNPNPNKTGMRISGHCSSIQTYAPTSLPTFSSIVLGYLPSGSLCINGHRKTICLGTDEDSISNRIQTLKDHFPDIASPIVMLYLLCRQRFRLIGHVPHLSKSTRALAMGFALHYNYVTPDIGCLLHVSLQFVCHSCCYRFPPSKAQSPRELFWTRQP